MNDDLAPKLLLGGILLLTVGMFFGTTHGITPPAPPARPRQNPAPQRSPWDQFLPQK
jgi:hypothetical protein